MANQFIGVYITGAGIQVIGHGNDKKNAIQHVIDASSSNDFDPSEDDSLLFELKEESSEGEMVFDYRTEHEVE